MPNQLPLAFPGMFVARGSRRTSRFVGKADVHCPNCGHRTAGSCAPSLLLMMVVNHSPSSLRRFTDQPIGFFTTAEAFVFVSAFLAGLLFRKRIEKNGFEAARSSTIHRAGKIYCARLLTLAFAFTIGSFLLTYLPGLKPLFGQYLKNPPAAIAASILLVFQPPLMDILPVYILFSLLTPLVFWAAGRWGWKTVVWTSLSIWSISQLRVRDLLVTGTKDLDYIDLGPFDVFAWQLLWVGGLCCGQRLYEKKRVLPLPKSLPLIYAFDRYHSSIRNTQAIFLSARDWPTANCILIRWLF